MKRKIAKNEVSQTINLKEFFGRNVSSDEKSRFISEAINRIIERTQDGKSIDNRSFKNYTKEYAEKKGVSRSAVDLTLLGDMLLSINSEQQRTNVVKLKIDESNQAAKAFAHSTGFQGHPRIKNGPKRDFFGLSKDEAQSIADRVKNNDDTSILGNASQEVRDRVLNNIFSSLGFEFTEGETGGEG